MALNYEEMLNILRSPPSPCSGSRRSASLASTSAGPTPRPPTRSDRSPRSEDEYSDHTGLFQATGPSTTEHDQDARQCRKVFVGGVPQEVDRVHLGSMFGSYGEVERAWLQRHRRDLRRNHRGFGFVLFKDERATHALLGDDLSRFFAMPDGTRLEVKRALGGAVAAPAPGRGRGAAPEVAKADADAQPAVHEPPVHGGGTGRGVVEAEAAVEVARQAQVVVVPAALPYLCAGQVVVMVPMVALPSPLPAAVRPRLAPELECRSTLEVALPAAAGPHLQLASEHECRRFLEAALLQAMPDHYED